MFKGFQKDQQFNSFPALNFQINNEAYGFSGCTFWLDASYGLNTQTDLAAVSSWQSKIGGITFTQNTAANQPRYNLSNPSYNNLPVVDFNDANRRMNAINQIYPSNNFCLIFVANYDSITQANTLLGNTATNAALSIDPQVLLGGTAAAAITGISTILNTGSRISATTETNTVKIAAINNLSIIVNGVSEYSGTINSILGGFNQLGMIRDQSIYGLYGKIAEIILFNRAFTNAEMITLSSRLNSKYAIY